MRNKKIILFLVEGVTDESTLGAIFSELIDSDQIKFQIYYGDLLSEYNSSPKNIKKEVGNQINKFLETEHFLKKRYF
jgi:hypothetical protein